MLPIASSDEETFEEVTYQGKTIKLGDTVIVSEAGQPRTVEVTQLIKKQGHYWVGYGADKLCPWPLVRVAGS